MGRLFYWACSYVLCTFTLAYLGSTITNGESYLVNSPNCKIRTPTTPYTKKIKGSPEKCGIRRIFLRSDSHNKVRFHIDSSHYNACVYKFIHPQYFRTDPDLDVSSDSWLPFRHETTIDLKSEFIKVFCSPTKKGNFYEDVYAKINKVIPNKLTHDSRKPHWNVLMIGIDSMSRERALSELPLTVNYFNNNGWLDFKGYNQVSQNQFQNFMSVLTNKNISLLYDLCEPDLGSCNDIFIWSRFKEEGYVTAFADDYDNISYTGSTKHIMTFNNPPTDHYMRTLFFAGEPKKGSKYCKKTMSLAEHVFTYAYDFVSTYKNDKFFGYFWVTSLSESPRYLDESVKLFFQVLERSGIMNNTFVFFFGDQAGAHENNAQVAAHPKVSLPMLFLQIPYSFRKLNPEKYVRVHVKQRQLISPFDVHLTLWDIARNFEFRPLLNHEGCAQCDSLFGMITLNRSCEDAGIPLIFCACQDWQPVSTREDYGAFYSIRIIMLKLYNITKSIETMPLTRCRELELEKILRVHKLTANSKTTYLFAGLLLPDHTEFEASVSKRVSAQSAIDSDQFGPWLRENYLKYEYNIESLVLARDPERPAECVRNKVDRIWCKCEKTVRNN